MSQESSNELAEVVKKRQMRRLLNPKVFSLPMWVVLSFFVAQILIAVFINLIEAIGVKLENFNQSISVLLLSAFAYILMLIFIIGVPWYIKRRKTTMNEIGLTRLPSWTDILLSPAGLVVYLLFSVLFSLIFAMVFPSIDLNQVQETGFENLTKNYEYYLAFVALVVLAPVAEEVIFRGYLYGKLKKYVPIWVAIIVTSVTFGAIHGAWNLAIDTFALSIILCLLRELTGNIWSSILLHMIKNGIAYYFLFINTSILTTLGG